MQLLYQSKEKGKTSVWDDDEKGLATRRTFSFAAEANHNKVVSVALTNKYFCILAEFPWVLNKRSTIRKRSQPLYYEAMHKEDYIFSAEQDPFS
jgi:hypothetical protein